MKSRRPLTNMEISAFCQQTFYLLQAGITPVDGMNILLQDAPSRSMKGMIESIHEDCEKGEKFSAAMQNCGRFPDYVINMVTLGEESGHLSNIMQSLADYYEREEAISSGLRDAVRYPLIMIGMMLVVMIVLIARVLPIFSQVYSQLGTEMTGFALTLLNVSNAMSRYSLVLIIIVAVIALIIFIVSKVMSSKGGMRNLLTSLPFFKGFADSVAAGRFASGMSLTLSSGLDTYESLDMVRNLVENRTMMRKIDKCKDFIKNGENFAEALRSAGIFSMFYTQMVVIGFKSGSVDTVMGRIARHYEEDTEAKIRSIISTLEPTLVILLSFFVGLILLSVIMPLMGIMSMIG